MAIEFSPSFRQFLEVWVGADVASGDEDRGYDSRLPYQKLAADLRALSGAMQGAIARVGYSMPPQVGDRFVGAMRLFVDDNGVNHLYRLADELEKTGQRQVGRSMKLAESKIEILVEFAIMNLELALLASLSVFTGGTSLAEAAAVKSRTALSILLIMQRMGRAAPMPVTALLEALEEAFTSFFAQFLSMQVPDSPDRRRTKFDWKDIGQSAYVGFLAGLFGGAMGEVYQKYVARHFKDKYWLKEGLEVPFEGVNEGQAEMFASGLSKLTFEGRFSLSWQEFWMSGVSGGLTSGAEIAVGAAGLGLYHHFFQKTPAQGSFSPFKQSLFGTNEAVRNNENHPLVSGPADGTRLTGPSGNPGADQATGIDIPDAVRPATTVPGRPSWPLTTGPVDLEIPGPANAEPGADVFTTRGQAPQDTGLTGSPTVSDTSGTPSVFSVGDLDITSSDLGDISDLSSASSLFSDVSDASSFTDAEHDVVPAAETDLGTDSQLVHGGEVPGTGTPAADAQVADPVGPLTGMQPDSAPQRAGGTAVSETFVKSTSEPRGSVQGTGRREDTTAEHVGSPEETEVVPPRDGSDVVVESTGQTGADSRPVTRHPSVPATSSTPASRTPNASETPTVSDAPVTSSGQSAPEPTDLAGAPAELVTSSTSTAQPAGTSSRMPGTGSEAGRSQVSPPPSGGSASGRLDGRGATPVTGTSTPPEESQHHSTDPVAIPGVDDSVTEEVLPGLSTTDVTPVQSPPRTSTSSPAPAAGTQTPDTRTGTQTPDTQTGTQTPDGSRAGTQRPDTRTGTQTPDGSRAGTRIVTVSGDTKTTVTPLRSTISIKPSVESAVPRIVLEEVGSATHSGAVSADVSSGTANDRVDSRRAERAQTAAPSRDWHRFGASASVPGTQSSGGVRPKSRWDAPEAVRQQITDSAGRRIGEMSFNAKDLESRKDVYGRLGEQRSYLQWRMDEHNRPVGEWKALPEGFGDSFFLALHHDDKGFHVVTSDGRSVVMSARELGRELRARQKELSGFKEITLLSCGSGAQVDRGGRAEIDAQIVADISGWTVNAPTGEVAMTPSSEGARLNLRYDADGKATVWRKFHPRALPEMTSVALDDSSSHQRSAITGTQPPMQGWNSAPGQADVTNDELTGSTSAMPPFIVVDDQGVRGCSTADEVPEDALEWREWRGLDGARKHDTPFWLSGEGYSQVDWDAVITYFAAGEPVWATRMNEYASELDRVARAAGDWTSDRIRWTAAEVQDWAGKLEAAVNRLELLAAGAPAPDAGALFLERAAEVRRLADVVAAALRGPIRGAAALGGVYHLRNAWTPLVGASRNLAAAVERAAGDVGNLRTGGMLPVSPASLRELNRHVRDFRNRRAYAQITHGTQWHRRLPDLADMDDSERDRFIKELSDENITTLREQIVPALSANPILAAFYGRLMALPMRFHHATPAYYAIANSGVMLSVAQMQRDSASHLAAGLTKKEDADSLGNTDFVFFRPLFDERPRQTYYGSTTLVFGPEILKDLRGWVSLHDQLVPTEGHTFRDLRMPGRATPVRTTELASSAGYEAGERTAWVHTYPDRDDAEVEVGFEEEVFDFEHAQEGLMLSVVREVVSIGGEFMERALGLTSEQDLADLVTRLYWAEAKIAPGLPVDLGGSELAKGWPRPIVVHNPDGDGRYLPDGSVDPYGMMAGTNAATADRALSNIDDTKYFVHELVMVVDQAVAESDILEAIAAVQKVGGEVSDELQKVKDATDDAIAAYQQLRANAVGDRAELADRLIQRRQDVLAEAEERAEEIIRVLRGAFANLNQRWLQNQAAEEQNQTAEVQSQTVGPEQFPTEGWNAPDPGHRPIPRDQEDVGTASDVTAAPRFPALYRKPDWQRVTAAYEKDLGTVLAADPRVVEEARKAVIALHGYLSGGVLDDERYHPDRVVHSFLPPGRATYIAGLEGHTLSATDLWKFGLGSVPLDELMDMFARGAYQRSSGVTLSRLWRDHPELNLRALPLAPSTPQPHSESFRRELQDRRGLRVTQAPATSVEWLLRVHDALQGDTLLFREAMLGWLLPRGTHSLAEILAAAQRAGVRDEVEPDVRRVDAARLYGWVDGVLAPRHRLREESFDQLRGADRDLADRLTPPHLHLYAQLMASSATAALEPGQRIEDILALAQQQSPADTLGALSPEAAREWRQRRAALADWLRRHQDIGILAANVNYAYAMAVYLISGPDGRLITAADAAEDGHRERLREEARGLVTAALADERPQFPLLFRMQERAFQVRRNTRALPSLRREEEADLLSRLAEQQADALGDVLVDYGELAVEALEMLPSVYARIYWISALPDGERGTAAPKPGSEVELPRFHRATTSQEVALGELRDLAGADVPVMWSVARATAPDISPLSRTPERRMVVYPSRTTFRVESTALHFDAESGRGFLRVELTELPPARPSEPWDRLIVTRDIRSAGRRIGVSSHTARDWSTRRDAFARFREISSWTTWDAVSQNYVGTARPLNWDGDWFVANAHGGPHLVSVVSRYGPRRVTAAQWGHYLKELVEEDGLPAHAKIFLFSCSAGAMEHGVGQVGADVMGHSTVGAATPIAIYSHAGRPGISMTARTRLESPSLVEFSPRPTAQRSEGPGFHEYGAGFRELYSDSRWESISEQYEKDLGEVMAADPDVLRAAWHLVDVLGRTYEAVLGTRMTTDGSARRLLGMLRQDTAASEAADRTVNDGQVWELLETVAQASLHAGLPVKRTQGDFADGWRRILGKFQGFGLASSRTDVAVRLLGVYADQVPAQRLPAARAALMAWLLRQERDSLYELLADSHTTEGFPAEEKSLLLGDAAHLYAWADRTFDTRAYGLMTPYQSVYAAKHTWLTPEVTGDGQVPEGIARTLDPDTVPPSANDPQLPALSCAVRRNAVGVWARRHSGPGITELLTPAHITALYLLSGRADRRLLTAAAGGSEGRRVTAALRDEVRAVVREAAEYMHVDGALNFPRLLLEDQEFRDLVQRARQKPAASPVAPTGRADLHDPLQARAQRLVHRLRTDAPEHLAMAAEALAFLPRVGASVWWSGWMARDAADHAVVTVPRFHAGSLNERVALAQMPVSGQSGGHPVLYEVVNSSARDVAPLSADPARAEALFPRRTDLEVLDRSWRRDAAGRAYLHVRLKDTTEREPELSDTTLEPVGPTGRQEPQDAETSQRYAHTAEEAVPVPQVPDAGPLDDGDAHPAEQGLGGISPNTFPRFAWNAAPDLQTDVPAETAGGGGTGGTDLTGVANPDPQSAPQPLTAADSVTAVLLGTTPGTSSARPETTADKPEGEDPSAVVRGPAEDAPYQSPSSEGGPALQGLVSRQSSEGAARHTDASEGAFTSSFAAYYGLPEWQRHTEEHEKAIGRTLAADPQVIEQARAAVGRLYTHLAMHHGAAKARRAFFPEHQYPGDVRKAMRRLRDPASDASLSEMMTAFANAAYANPSDQYTLSGLLNRRGNRPRMRWQRLISALPSTMRRWWASLGRPLRVRTGAALPPGPGPASPRDAAWLAESRDRRGLRVGQSSADSAAWLLQVHHWLNVPDSDPLMFRQALLGWLLPSGEYSLFDILEASREAGSPGETDPDLSRIDAASLYGWADGHLDPRGLLDEPDVRERINPDARRARRTALTPPHQRLYSARTNWLTSHVTGEGAGADAIFRQIQATASRGAVPPPHRPLWRERREALHDWLLRHDGIQLLENAKAAYVPALYLISGADARLLDERFGAGGEAVLPLKARAREIVADAFTSAGRSSDADFRSSLPLLFLRDERFRELARQAETLVGRPVAEGPETRLARLRYELTERAEQLVETLQEELAEHRGMATEALAMMPPVTSSVYWITEQADIPAEGVRLSLPRFHGATTRFGTVRAQLFGRGADVRAVVWEAENSTGRDISPFSRMPGEGTVRYARPVTFEVVAREERLDASGRSYAYIRVREVAAPLPPQAWKQDIVVRPIVSDGRPIGESSFTEREAARFADPFRRLAGMRTYTTALLRPDGSSYPSGYPAEPQPWGENVHHFSAHGTPEHLITVSPAGLRATSADEVGAFLGRLLRDQQVPPGTELVLESCSAGHKQAIQRIAHRADHVTYAPPGVMTLGPVMRLLHSPYDPKPTWVVSHPGDRTRVSAQVPGYQTGQLTWAEVYTDPLWAGLTLRYEDALGRVLATDPRTLAGARDVIRWIFDAHRATLGPDDAMKQFFDPQSQAETDYSAAFDRLLDENSGATLHELMTAVTFGLLGTSPTLRSASDQLSPDVVMEHRDERGFALIFEDQNLSRRLFQAYGRRLRHAPAQGRALIVRAVTAWLLPGNTASLYAVTDTALRVFGDLLETETSAAVAADAAHLYEWADKAYAPRTSASDELRDRLTPPHLAAYEMLTAPAVPSATEAKNLPGYEAAALRLLAGADSALLDASFIGGTRSRDRLAEATRSAVLRAIATDGRFPALLMRDAAFDSQVEQVKATPSVEASLTESNPAVTALLRRATELIDGVQAQLPAHLAMAARALGALPSVSAPVWWGTWASGPLNSDAAPDTVSVPRFHRVSLDLRSALDGTAAARPASGNHHPVLVEVIDSSARDLSAFSDLTGPSEARYANDAMLDVVRHEVRRDRLTGLDYRHLWVRERGRPGLASPGDGSRGGEEPGTRVPDPAGPGHPDNGGSQTQDPSAGGAGPRRDAAPSAGSTPPRDFTPAQGAQTDPVLPAEDDRHAAWFRGGHLEAPRHQEARALGLTSANRADVPQDGPQDAWQPFRHLATHSSSQTSQHTGEGVRPPRITITDPDGTVIEDLVPMDGAGEEHANVTQESTSPVTALGSDSPSGGDRWRLPSYLERMRAAGPAEFHSLVGLDWVEETIRVLTGAVAPGPITEELRSWPGRFVGSGKSFHMRGGDGWYDVTVAMVRHPDESRPLITSLPHLDGAVPTVKPGTSTSLGSSRSASVSQGYSARAAGTLLVPTPTPGLLAGATGAAGVAFGRRTVSTTSSQGFTDSRRSAHASGSVDVPRRVQWVVTARKAGVSRGRVFHGDGSAVVRVPVEHLVRSGDRSAARRPEPVDAEKARGAELAESLSLIAAYDQESESEPAGGLLRTVSSVLHPALTAPGSPGRSTVMAETSPDNVARTLVTAFEGWTDSPDLLGRGGSVRGGYRMRARITALAAVSTVDDTKVKNQQKFNQDNATQAGMASGADVAAGPVLGVGLMGGGPRARVFLQPGLMAARSRAVSQSTGVQTAQGAEISGTQVLYKARVRVTVEGTGPVPPRARTKAGARAGEHEMTVWLSLRLEEAKTLGLPLPAGVDSPPLFRSPGVDRHLPVRARGAGTVLSMVDTEPLIQRIEDLFATDERLAGFLPRFGQVTQSPAFFETEDDRAWQLANHRALTQALSPRGLRTRKGMLLTTGIPVRLRRKHWNATESVLIRVGGRLVDDAARYLGDIDDWAVISGRRVNASGRSGGDVEQGATIRLGFSAKPVPGHLYLSGALTAARNTARGAQAGPSASRGLLSAGTKTASAFAGTLRFEVTVTSVQLPRRWRRIATPGLPGQHAPELSVLASTDPAGRHGVRQLDVPDAPVRLTTPASMTFSEPPRADSRVYALPHPVPVPPVAGIGTLFDPQWAPPQDGQRRLTEWLVMEAAADPSQLQGLARTLLARAAGGDTALSVPGLDAALAIEELMSDESIVAGLPRALKGAWVVDGLRHDRRWNGVTGAVGIRFNVVNPSVVQVAEGPEVESSISGGHSATSAGERAVAVGVGMSVSGAGDVPPQAPKVWLLGGPGVSHGRRWSAARRIGTSGTVERIGVSERGSRVALVQADLEVFMVAEASVRGGEPRVEAQGVRLDRSVMAWVTEQQAVSMGLGPQIQGRPEQAEVANGTSTEETAVQTDGAATDPIVDPAAGLELPGTGPLGPGGIERLPDFGRLLPGLREEIAKVHGAKLAEELLPLHVVRDTWRNTQRLAAVLDPVGAAGLLSSAMDGGVQVELFRPGSANAYVARFVVTRGTGTFEDRPEDRSDMVYATSASSNETISQSVTKSSGVNAVALPVVSLGDAAGGVAPPLTTELDRADTAGQGYSRSHDVTAVTVAPASADYVRFRVPVTDARLELYEPGADVGAGATPVLSVSLDAPATGRDDRYVLYRVLESDARAMAALARQEALVPPNWHLMSRREPLESWRTQGVALPAGVQVFSLEGVPLIRAALAEMARTMGVHQGFTRTGTAQSYVMHESLTSEWLTASLPVLTKTGARLPDVYLAGARGGQELRVSLHARLTQGEVLGTGERLEWEYSDGLTPGMPRLASTDRSNSSGGAHGAGSSGGGSWLKYGHDSVHDYGMTAGTSRGANSGVSGSVTSGTDVPVSVRTPYVLVSFAVDFRLIAALNGGLRADGLSKGRNDTELRLPRRAAVRMPLESALELVAAGTVADPGGHLEAVAPLSGPKAPWQSTVLKRPILDKDGKAIGTASFTPADWKRREAVYQGLNEVTEYVERSAGPGESLPTTRPLPLAGRSRYWLAMYGAENRHTVATADGTTWDLDDNWQALRDIYADLATVPLGSVIVLLKDGPGPAEHSEPSANSDVAAGGSIPVARRIATATGLTVIEPAAAHRVTGAEDGSARIELSPGPGRGPARWWIFRPGDPEPQEYPVEPRVEPEPAVPGSTTQPGGAGETLEAAPAGPQPPETHRFRREGPETEKRYVQWQRDDQKGRIANWQDFPDSGFGTDTENQTAHSAVHGGVSGKAPDPTAHVDPQEIDDLRGVHAAAVHDLADAVRTVDGLRHRVVTGEGGSRDVEALHEATARAEQAERHLARTEDRLRELGADPYAPEANPFPGVVPVVHRDDAQRQWIAQQITADDLPGDLSGLDLNGGVTSAELSAAGVSLSPEQQAQAVLNAGRLPLAGSGLTPVDQVKVLMLQRGPWPNALDVGAANAARRLWQQSYRDFSDAAPDVPVQTVERAWDTAAGLVLPLELHPVLADSRYAGDEYRDAVRQVADVLVTGGSLEVATALADGRRHTLGLPPRARGGARNDTPAVSEAPVSVPTLDESLPPTVVERGQQHVVRTETVAPHESEPSSATGRPTAAFHGVADGGDNGLPYEQLHNHPGGPALRVRGPRNSRMKGRTPNQITDRDAWGGISEPHRSAYKERLDIHRDPNTLFETEGDLRNALASAAMNLISTPGASKNADLEQLGRNDNVTEGYWLAQDRRDEQLTRDTARRLERYLSDNGSARPSRQYVDAVLARAASPLRQIESLLQGHEGVIIGGSHGGAPVWGFLIDNMASLRAAGVDTIYLESLRDDSFQAAVDEYLSPTPGVSSASGARRAKAGVVGQVDPAALLVFAAKYDRTHNLTTGRGLTALLEAAKRHGMRLRGIDGRPARRRDAFTVHLRYMRAARMNTYAEQVVRHDRTGRTAPGKYLMEVGAAHAVEHMAPGGGSFQEDGQHFEDRPFPGLSELLGVPPVELVNEEASGPRFRQIPGGQANALPMADRRGEADPDTTVPVLDPQSRPIDRIPRLEEISRFGLPAISESAQTLGEAASGSHPALVPPPGPGPELTGPDELTAMSSQSGVVGAAWPSADPTPSRTGTDATEMAAGGSVPVAGRIATATGLTVIEPAAPHRVTGAEDGSARIELSPDPRAGETLEAAPEGPQATETHRFRREGPETVSFEGRSFRLQPSSDEGGFDSVLLTALRFEAPLALQALPGMQDVMPGEASTPVPAGAVDLLRTWVYSRLTDADIPADLQGPASGERFSLDELVAAGYAVDRALRTQAEPMGGTLALEEMGAGAGIGRVQWYRLLAARGGLPAGSFVEVTALVVARELGIRLVIAGPEDGRFREFGAVTAPTVLIVLAGTHYRPAVRHRPRIQGRHDG
ncbi:hypothetical protein [Streptomyces sp. NPDC052721]|uniref:hypothetical protein n=1 Tax=Streptomyces sp. NPDC052721 TaxID=3154955 RepID=UPI0034343708